MKEETAILPASIPNAPLTNTLPPTPMPATLSTNVANNAWPCTASQYEQGALISKGGFSTVLTGICKTNQQKICIKILELETMALSFEEVLQEIQLMRLCNDANILTFHTNFVHKEELWLITQLMDKGSCLRVMSISKALNLGEGFSEECLAFILAETLKGLHYLHSKSLIHRDVKPGNILLDSRGGVKVSDLALSGTMAVEVGQRAQKAKTVIGTPCYMAPEVLEQQQNQGGYDHRADIWSLGITALELAKGYAPYAHLAAMKIMSLTLDSDPPSLKNYPYDKQLSPTGPAFSKNYDDFYKQCLQKHPKHRPSAAELLKHRLVRSVTCDALVAFLQNIPNIDDIEATTSILGAAATSSNQTHNAHSTIADLLQEFEDLNLDANHAVTSTVWNNGDPATASDAPGLLSTHSSKSIDEGMKTPSRFVTSQRSFDDVDGANNQGNNNNNEHHRSRSLSNHLLDPSASDDPSATSSRDHPSAATTQQNSENNSAKLPFPGQIETHRDLSEDSKDATPGSTYIPGTTWVFETSVRGENGAFKSAQTIAAELQKKKSSEEERVMREEEGEGSNDIADFLDEFEEQEATIKTSSDKIQR